MKFYKRRDPDEVARELSGWPSLPPRTRRIPIWETEDFKRRYDEAFSLPHRPLPPEAPPVVALGGVVPATRLPEGEVPEGKAPEADQAKVDERGK